MNIKKFLNQITKNWPAKVICLVIAILIYFFHQLSTLSSRTFSIPLEVEAEGNLVPSANFNKYRYVKVTVRAKKDDLAKVSEKDFKAKIVITNETQEGFYKIPVITDCEPQVLLIEPFEIKTSPEYIPITLEEKTFSFVPVEPLLSGNVAYGYEKESVEIFPETVKISGPRSIIGAIKSVQTDEVKIGGITSTSISRVKILNDNSFLEFDRDALFDVVVNVREIDGERTFLKIPVTVTNLPEKFEMPANIPTVDLGLGGKILELEAISKSAIKATVDLSKAEKGGPFEAEIKVSLPKNVKLVSKSLEKVRLVLAEKVSPELNEATETEKSEPQPAYTPAGTITEEVHENAGAKATDTAAR